MIVSSLLCFLMSVMWISFSCNVIMDLLQLFSFITALPPALLALTVIGWGNSLGDFTADVAMTKRGFGEMAITGTTAGPVFNINCGLGLSQVIGLLKLEDPFNTKIVFELYDTIDGKKVFNKVAVLPMVMMLGQMFSLIILGLNGITHGYKVSFRFGFISAVVYICVITGLVVYSLVDDVVPPSG